MVDSSSRRRSWLRRLLGASRFVLCSLVRRRLSGGAPSVRRREPRPSIISTWRRPRTSSPTLVPGRSAAYAASRSRAPAAATLRCSPALGIEAAAERADVPRRAVGVAHGNAHGVARHAELLGHQQRQRRVRALAHLHLADEGVDRAVRADVNPCASVWKCGPAFSRWCRRIAGARRSQGALMVGLRAAPPRSGARRRRSADARSSGRGYVEEG